MRKKRPTKPLDPRAPIYITTKEIAKLTQLSTQYLNRKLEFIPTNYWNNFWILVAYLEKKGLRPEAPTGL